MKRPTYDPPQDGPSEEEAGRDKSPEEVYDQYCGHYGVEYKEEFVVGFYSSPMEPFEVEFHELDPAGEYELISAVCQEVQEDGSRTDLPVPPPAFYPGIISWVNVIQEPPDPGEMENGIREAIEAEVEAIPVEPGEMAPPMDQGVVNTPTWLWVDTEWETVEATESMGMVTIWAGAEPVKSVYRIDGEVIAECDGAGTPYTGGPLSTGSDCTGEFEEASVQGRQGSVEIVWEFVWGEEIAGEEFFYGPLGDPYTTSADVTWTVDEVFSTETG